MALLLRDLCELRGKSFLGLRAATLLGMMLFCGMVTVAAVSFAQAPSTGVVEAHAIAATDAAHPNSTLKIAVVAQVAPGYHINDHKPTLDYLIPTVLQLEPSPQIAVKDVIYPKGTMVTLAFSDSALSVYEGTVAVGAVLDIAKAVPPGSYPVKGMVKYQACNDHACLPPTNAPLTLTVKVVPRSVPLKPVESVVFQRIKFE